jgi:hypothetical protein
VICDTSCQSSARLPPKLRIKSKIIWTYDIYIYIYTLNIINHKNI